MAIITTKAIVLSSLKYNDSSLIVKCYTQEEGVKSYLIRGILKSKKGGLKIAYFQPLTQLKMVVNHNSKGNLNTIKEVQVSFSYKTIYNNIVKQSVVLFLSEVLSNAIQEEEKNSDFFKYLETALIWLDLHDKVSNFHLLFLLNSTRFLGFYPDLSDNKKQGFSLFDGSFSDAIDDRYIITGNTLYQFKKLLNTNFDSLDTIAYSKEERQLVLQTIIKYYELHLSGFRKPKSLQILETVFK